MALTDTDHLVRLHAQPPLRMRLAVGNGQLGVAHTVGSVHGLEVKMREGHVLKTRWIHIDLGVDQLELAA